MNFFKQGDSLLARLTKIKHVHLVTFFVAFLEATISPILPEAFVLILVTYRKDLSWKILSLVSALGSSCGALLMYTFGAFLYTRFGASLLHVLHGEMMFDKAKILFTENAFSAQFLASLTPLPDRVFSFLAGAFSVSIITVFFATFLGRLARVLPVAFFAFTYGDQARHYITRHTKRASYILVAFIIVYIMYSYFL